MNMVKIFGPLDIRVLILTGTSGGVTGGDVIPNGMIGVIRHIAYSEMNATGQNILLRTQPSGTQLDAKRLDPSEKWPNNWAMPEDIPALGVIGQSNVLQAVTSQGSVVVRVMYTLEDGRASG